MISIIIIVTFHSDSPHTYYRTYHCYLRRLTILMYHCLSSPLDRFPTESSEILYLLLHYSDIEFQCHLKLHDTCYSLFFMFLLLYKAERVA